MDGLLIGLVSSCFFESGRDFSLFETIGKLLGFDCCNYNETGWYVYARSCMSKNPIRGPRTAQIAFSRLAVVMWLELLSLLRNGNEIYFQ